MNEYETRLFPYVDNDSYRFLEVSINGKYPFQEFMENLRDEYKDLKKIKQIFAYMDMLKPGIMLPSDKFRHIVGTTSSLFWEFKKDNVRVYVIKCKPDVYVVLGGYKGTQKNDIKKLDRLFGDFINMMGLI